MGKNVVYAATPNRTSPEFSLTEYAAAGAFSALPTTLVAAPMERVKVLLQARPLALTEIVCYNRDA